MKHPLFKSCNRFPVFSNIPFHRPPWKRIFLILGTMLAVVFLLLLILIWSLTASAPELDQVQISPTGSATYLCDQEGTVLRKLSFASTNRDIIALSQVSADMQNAIVAIEDERFYEHNGIDLYGIARAFVTGIRTGRFSEGASTITQQLIKNRVFTEWTQERSFFDRFQRKIQEQYLALQLEKTMSKEEILENYLNTINFGAGSYGIQAAAQRYFGKNATELTLSESAVLAAIPQNPTSLNPILHPEKNRSRQQTILQYMLEQDFITQNEYNFALSDDVYSRILAYDASLEESSVYSWYEDALISQVILDLQNTFHCSAEQAQDAVYSGGLRIFSAQDSKLQQICEEEFQNPENFPQETQFGIDYALSISDVQEQVVHYGSDALCSWIRQTLDPDFSLMCSSQETAQQYADAFRAHILSETGEASAPDHTASKNMPASVTILGERLTLTPQPQASLVLIDQNTGFVRALVGGRGQKEASLTLNRATSSLRQPGSTFKILTAYAPALDTCGQTLVTRYENEPYTYLDGTPVENWDQQDYSGSVTIREAILRSVNVAAVKCITDITPRLGFDYAQKFGISTLHESYESNGTTSTDLIQPLALGGVTEGVSNLELCGAYAAIANGGIYCRPKFYTKILDRNGNILIDHSSDSEQLPTDSVTDQQTYKDHTRILQKETAFLLTSAMQDVVDDPRGTAYGTIYAAGQPVAGKTGTTSSYKDVWFVGYTPYYTCSIWGGYDHNQSLPDRSSYHSYHKTLWSAVMTRIHTDLPAAAFEQPDTITAVTLCRATDLPAKEGICPDTYTEYFTQNTQPIKVCYLHEALPETEPIILYDQFLDQLLPSESETVPVQSEETSETDSEPAQSEGTSETASEPAQGETFDPDKNENGNDTQNPFPEPDLPETLEQMLRHLNPKL